MVVSSRFQPAPTPKMNRPWLCKSNTAISLASISGLRSVTNVMPVASLIVLVTAAAIANAI
jgi:hypothetical protein